MLLKNKANYHAKALLIKNKYSLNKDRSKSESKNKNVKIQLESIEHSFHANFKRQNKLQKIFPPNNLMHHK